MSAPLLSLYGYMSRAMFAGVFLIVGWGSVESNPIVHRTLFLLRDPKLTPRDHELRGATRAGIGKFLVVQWVWFLVIIAVSQIIAGSSFVLSLLLPSFLSPSPDLVRLEIGILKLTSTIPAICFPVIIILLIPFRHYTLPSFISAHDLSILDAPTANSDAVFVSLGGPLVDKEQAEEEAKGDIESRSTAVEEGGMEEKDGVRLRK